ncbi:MAG TPA: hypothetical protein VMX17_14145 [Candidatus Glassbacteria bacterium]|nr:hypothetical protein [Candidatus Glassbacteria bacterium]
MKSIIPEKPPYKTLPFDELISIYKAIVDKFGDKSLNSGWMSKNGFSWMHGQILKKHKISWNEFKNKCNFKSIFRRDNLSLEELIIEYKKTIKENGEKAYSSRWIIKESGKCWIHGQATKSHGLSWNEFREKCGIKHKIKHGKREETLEELKNIYTNIVKKHGEKAYKCMWVIKNGPSGLYEQVTRKHKLTWNEFREACGIDFKFKNKHVSLKKLINIYKSVVDEHGKSAYNNVWMRNGEYRWIVSNVNDHGLSWNEFKEACGINFKLKRTNMELPEIIDIYVNVINENGNKSLSISWAVKNGYNWLTQQIKIKHKIPWRRFVQMCKPEIEMEFSW